MSKVKRRILVTGANGFVGRRLCRTAAARGILVRPVTRREDRRNLQGLSDVAVVNDIGPLTDWTSVLSDIDIVIHLAARVHVMKESVKDPLDEYRRVNVEGTRCLALAAAKSGVKRFVYVSTVKVNGERTYHHPFSEKDAPSPQDPYATSKCEAEEVLLTISKSFGIEVVIVRPPLVYGPGVKGNMFSLMRYVARGLPMPFGGINNIRSFISLDNLCDVLICSATKAACAGHTFVVSDGEDLSTPELIKLIAGAMNRKSHLINIPEKVFSIFGSVLPAFRPISERLTGSLVIDSSLFRRVAEWIPVQTVNDGIKAMVEEYLLKCR